MYFGVNDAYDGDMGGATLFVVLRQSSRGRGLRSVCFWTAHLYSPINSRGSLQFVMLSEDDDQSGSRSETDSVVVGQTEAKGVIRILILRTTGARLAGILAD